LSIERQGGSKAWLVIQASALTLFKVGLVLAGVGFLGWLTKVRSAETMGMDGAAISFGLWLVLVILGTLVRNPRGKTQQVSSPA
jgi:hypothetical protein